VRHVINIVCVLIVAAAIGLSLTDYVARHGSPFGALRIGPWTAYPKIGTQDADPYSRAVMARSGELPLGSGDGLEFLARTDDAGRAFEGRCDLKLSGSTPQARYWTLALYDPGGRVIPNALGRYGMTSGEIIRDADGRFDITIAPSVRPGNWIPSGQVLTYVLALRLYETTAAAASLIGRARSMPTLRMGPCP
jgi:hypothetical protein